MSASSLLDRQSRRLLQIGVVFLLLTSFEGFAIPGFAAPQLGLSAHKLAGLQSVLLLALGLAWPRLRLGAEASRAAFWLLVYSSLAILAAYVLQYSAILWAAVMGYLVWRDAPTAPIVVGNAVIIGGGLYLLRSERRASGVRSRRRR